MADALNASIEAARTGETGRGFAVVTEDIERIESQNSTLVDVASYGRIQSGGRVIIANKYSFLTNIKLYFNP